MTQGIIFDDATAKDIIAIVRHYRRNGFPPAVGSSSLFNPSTPTPIYVHNESGEEIPAYACMQVTGTEEIDGRNFLLVDQPADTTGDAGWYLFNGPNPIADNEEGVAQSGNVVRGYKNTGTVTAGNRWQPVDGQWYIEKYEAGIFVATGSDDVADDVLRVITSTSHSIVCQTPGGGIAARSGSTVSSASCTIYKRASSTLSSASDTLTVYNLSTTAVAGSAYIVACPTNIGYVAVWEDC